MPVFNALFYLVTEWFGYRNFIKNAISIHCTQSRRLGLCHGATFKEMMHIMNYYPQAGQVSNLYTN